MKTFARAKFVATAFILSLFMTACSTVDKRDSEGFDPEQCNEQAAYERGVAEGREGMTPKTLFARHCRDDLQPKAYDGYNRGYDKGYTEYKEQRAKQEAEWKEMRQESERQQERERQRAKGQANPPVQTGPVIIIGGSGSPYANPKKYLCTVHAFTKTFSSFGPTELEAKQAAKDKCAMEYNPMHCDHVSCEMNH